MSHDSGSVEPPRLFVQQFVKWKGCPGKHSAGGWETREGSISRGNRSAGLEAALRPAATERETHLPLGSSPIRDSGMLVFSVNGNLPSYDAPLFNVEVDPVGNRFEPFETHVGFPHAGYRKPVVLVRQRSGDSARFKILQSVKRFYQAVV
jgi:hypothetical protein